MEDMMLLQKIGEMMDSKLNAMNASIDKRFSGLEEEIGLLKQDVQDVRQEMHETRIIVESLPKQIQLIAEQHGDIIENQKNVDDYPETKSRVSTLEHVAQAHTKKITELKQAAV